MVFVKSDPKLPRKKVSSQYEKGEAPVEFASKVQEYYRQLCLSCHCNGCQLYS